MSSTTSPPFSVQLFRDVILGNPWHVNLNLNGPYTLGVHNMGLVDANNAPNLYRGTVRVVDFEGQEICRYTPREYHQFVGYGQVIVLDSTQTWDGHPGDWCTFKDAALRTTMNLSNVHDTNFATALEPGRHMGLALAPDERIVVFAVEIEDNLTFDERLSDALEVAYPEYSAEIFAEIERRLPS